MTTETEQTYELLTISEVAKKLKSRFLIVHIGDQGFCFKILEVKEIIEKNPTFLETDKRVTERENISGVIKRNGDVIPVFDFRKDMKFNTQKEPITLIMDVAGNGLILQIGIMVNILEDVFCKTMQERSEEGFN